MRALLLLFFLTGRLWSANPFTSDNTVDWSLSGLPEGSARIKSDTFTMFADVTQAPYNADNTGVLDSALAIQAAYSACPSNSYIYLPAGTYTWSTNLLMNRSGVEIRGAGSRATFIRWTNTNAANQIFNWSPTSINFDWLNATNSALIAGFGKGSTNLHVFTNGWAPGMFVLLDERYDNSALDRVGSSASPTWTSRPSTDNLTFTNDYGRRCHQQKVRILTVSG